MLSSLPNVVCWLEGGGVCFTGPCMYLKIFMERLFDLELNVIRTDYGTLGFFSSCPEM
jgi:hypothetical protein